MRGCLMHKSEDSELYTIIALLFEQVTTAALGAHTICCEDGRLLGSNVPSVNIYINAATVKVCVSVPLTLL